VRRQLFHFTGRKENVASLLPLPQFEAIRHDITHPLFVEVDEIYNLACPASLIHYRSIRCRPPRPA
jgi:UDP-glucuronate decarboxylase